MRRTERNTRSKRFSKPGRWIDIQWGTGGFAPDFDATVSGAVFQKPPTPWRRWAMPITDVAWPLLLVGTLLHPAWKSSLLAWLFTGPEPMGLQALSTTCYWVASIGLPLMVCFGYPRRVAHGHNGPLPWGALMFWIVTIPVLTAGVWALALTTPDYKVGFVAEMGLGFWTLGGVVLSATLVGYLLRRMGRVLRARRIEKTGIRVSWYRPLPVEETAPTNPLARLRLSLGNELFLIISGSLLLTLLSVIPGAASLGSALALLVKPVGIVLMIVAFISCWNSWRSGEPYGDTPPKAKDLDVPESTESTESPTRTSGIARTVADDAVEDDEGFDDDDDLDDEDFDDDDGEGTHHEVFFNDHRWMQWGPRFRDTTNIFS